MNYEKTKKELEVFINRIINHEIERDAILSVLNNSSCKKVIPIRELHQNIMSYRKKYNIYIPFTVEERKMIDDVFHYWG